MKSGIVSKKAASNTPADDAGDAKPATGSACSRSGQSATSEKRTDTGRVEPGIRYLHAMTGRVGPAMSTGRNKPHHVGF